MGTRIKQSNLTWINLMCSLKDLQDLMILIKMYLNFRGSPVLK